MCFDLSYGQKSPALPPNPENLGVSLLRFSDALCL